MAYTTIDDPSAYFQTTLYTGNGNGSGQAITHGGNSDLQADWIWIKNRTDAENHSVTDSVRGGGKGVLSNSSDAESNNNSNGYLSSFNSDGFTTANAGVYNNASSKNYVSWNWKAGTSFSNSSGSNGANLDSTGSVSTTAGFSIVSFTGNRSTTRNIYHGLGAVPKMIIFKNRDTTNGWTIYNEAIGNANKLTLNGTNASGACTACFASTTPTSTLFTVGDDSDTNGTSNNMIAYCFADVQGYSKFGSYTGNGNADGTFVYTGFKPAWLMVKRTDGTDYWYMYDNKRDVDNVIEHKLEANDSAAEYTSVDWLDFTSNGFKWRYTGGGVNASGGSFIYMAFAENPFVTSSGVPATAR